MHINMDLCQMVSKSKDSIYCVQSWLLYLDFFFKNIHFSFQTNHCELNFFRILTHGEGRLSPTLHSFSIHSFSQPHQCVSEHMKQLIDSLNMAEA